MINTFFKIKPEMQFCDLVDEQVLGQMPALAESTPEDDSKADASNSASLYKVTPAALEDQTTIHISHLFN